MTWQDYNKQEINNKIERERKRGNIHDIKLSQVNEDKSFSFDKNYNQNDKCGTEVT